ncbi:uncharacterized protein LOC127735504 [Mytilus californianus]|uniref:uncharacterized protein LOC127735504 n=1 Tax=Mytilus californianus TaxID=6549 RepID=UPI00224808D9|nr:uncharacterized protein LOC127735504 [Mytilus californianus]
MENISIVNNKSNQLDEEDVSIHLGDDEILSCNGAASDSLISETTALLSSEDSHLHLQQSFTGQNPTLSSDSDIQLHCSQFPLQKRDFRNSSVNELSDETFLKLNIDEEFRDLPDGKQYHLFVSYSSGDVIEVNKICGQLEKRFFLKCLNYERDFTPGKRIDQNIYDTMIQSVAVLTVLSPNFIESSWCMTEAQHALDLSYKSRNHLRLIPILIRTPDEELPTLLKSHRYIDARNIEDIPAKIFDVYSNPGVNKLEFIEQTVDKSGQNGATNWYLQADRHSHLCDKVYTYQFPKLTEANVDKITAYNPNCEEQVRTVISYVNNHTFIKYYRILNSQTCSCLACLLVWMITALISLALGNFIITIRRNTEGSTGLVLMSVGAVVVSIAASCAWCIAFSKKKSKLLVNLQTGIWNINEKYYESSKCLIEFVTYTDYPCLEGTRYDTSKCKEHLCSFVKNKLEWDVEERIKVYVNTLIKKMLKALQFKGFKNWRLFEECEFNIHNTWKNRQCLCQMIEKELNAMLK